MHKRYARGAFAAFIGMGAMLVAVSFVANAATAATTKIVHPAPPTSPLLTQEIVLQGAYKEAWSSLDRSYASRDKLTGDWATWRDKYDGRLHTEQDLTLALTDLMLRVNDPEVRLLSPAQAAAANFSALGGHLGYGLQAKFLPVFGHYARLRVTEKVLQACNGEQCWSGEGQGYKDGLRDGDILFAVDHRSFEGWNDMDLFGYVISQKNPVVFSVKRGDEFLDVETHPSPTRPMNYNLDIAVEALDAEVRPFVFADSVGSAIQAGIAESDELESVNGVAAASMNDQDLRNLRGDCRPGDTLRLKVRRLDHEVVVSCGFATAYANLSGSAGGIAEKFVPWQISIRNLDDPKAPGWTEKFLSGYKPSTTPVVAIIDLRSSTGADDRAVEKIAGSFVHDGSLFCLTAGWRSDKLCDRMDGGRVVDSFGRVQSEPAFPFTGEIVVIIDDATSGSALLLTAILQEHGAKVVTSGKSDRQLSGVISTTSLRGDPAARWMQYPDFHHVLANGRSEFNADVVVAAGDEFKTVQKMYELHFPPQDQRLND